MAMSDIADVGDFVSFGRPVDEVLKDAFDQFGMEPLGGASGGQGWSAYSALQKCPYYFYSLYRAPQVRSEGYGSDKSALTVGSLLHALLSIHYYPFNETPDGVVVPTTEEFKDALMAHGASATAVMEVWRLFGAYAFNYEEDAFNRPLAVELRAEDPSTGDSCRYDLIVDVESQQLDYPAGIWIVDHKSTSRFDTATLAAWRGDGEIIGQQMIYQASGLDQVYGPLQGSIVNVIGKQKIPQFTRIVVPFEQWKIDEHREHLKMWRATKAIYDATNTWPKARSSCVGRYGACPMLDRCNVDGTYQLGGSSDE